MASPAIANDCVGSEKSRCCCVSWSFLGDGLLGAGVLGNSLGSLRDSVLGKFTWQQQTHRRLNLAARDGGSLVVMRQARRFRCDPLEDVVHEAVHDGHGLARNAGVRVDLLEHLVDVDGEAFLPAALLLLLVRGADILLGLAGLLDGFTARLRRHRA